MEKMLNYIENYKPEEENEVNMTNYAKFLVEKSGLKVGDTIRKNYGACKQGNKIYEVTEITGEVIVAKCVNIIKPSISQKKNFENEMKEVVTIKIAEAGSFPRFVIFERR